MDSNTQSKPPESDGKALDDSLTTKTDALFKRTDLTPEQRQKELIRIIQDHRKSVKG